MSIPGQEFPKRQSLLEAHHCDSGYVMGISLMEMSCQLGPTFWHIIIVPTMEA